MEVIVFVEVFEDTLLHSNHSDSYDDEDDDDENDNDCDKYTG